MPTTRQSDREAFIDATYDSVCKRLSLRQKELTRDHILKECWHKEDNYGIDKVDV